MDEEDSENNVDAETLDESVEEVESESRNELELSDEKTRARRQTFFKTQNQSKSPVAAYQVTPGGKWSTEEADEEILKFLKRLAGERDLIDSTDPIDFAKENDLLLLELWSSLMD